MRALAITFSLLLSTATHAETLVCFGDSVTLGRGVAITDNFCSQLGKARKSVVINSGVGGNNTRQARLRFQQDVLRHRPDVVTIMFGLNDSFVESGATQSRIPVQEYEANLLHFIRVLNRRGVQILLATSNCTANAWENYALRPYVEVVRKLGKQFKLPVVDVYTLTAQLQVEGAELYTDRVHPNTFAHTHIANEFINSGD